MSKSEKQNIKLDKVDDKIAYENLLVKYAELENKIADIKANCDLAIEGRDIKIKELEQQIEKMKCCSNCKHFNKEEDIEHCWNCERQLVNSLDNLKTEEIIKDEWEIKENE